MHLRKIQHLGWHVPIINILFDINIMHGFSRGQFYLVGIAPNLSTIFLFWSIYSYGFVFREEW